MLRALAMLGRATLFFGLWLVLVDSTDEPDMITGAVCVVIAVALATAVQSLRSVHARPRPSMFRYAHRPLLALVTDSVRVTAALGAALLLRRPIQGRFRAVRYRATGDEPDAVARRILTEWAGSVGANRYVLGIDTDNELLLVHELVASPGRLDPLELG